MDRGKNIERASISLPQSIILRLIQHTFPLPDGGALRLTVAEYLTPSLRHVTHVGAAQFDQSSGRWIGGGIKPDILCESNGIPSNVGADLCVGVGLDALSEADSRSSLLKQIGTRRDSRPPLHNALGGPFKVGTELNCFYSNFLHP